MQAAGRPGWFGAGRSECVAADHARRYTGPARGAWRHPAPAGTAAHPQRFPISFSTFPLIAPLQRASAGSGYLEPTPVQAAVIPAALDGADVLAVAQTGSGKTVAFGLPLLQQVQSSPAGSPRRIKALVLLPTRELAMQVGAVLRKLARFLPDPPKQVVVFGGVSANPQMLRLRGGADVLVATPGRLLDLVDKNAVQLGALQLLVLDEADRLLDAGFADELARVLALLPGRRQTLLFSATMPAAVQRLADSLLRDPVQVRIADTALTVPAIVQRVVSVDAPRRTALLRHLMQTQGWKRALVFVATQHAAETVAAKLYANGVYATPFHGGLSQGARTQVIDELHKGQWDVVVTTDLAARGLDIAQLPVVVNYDLPRSAVDYVHRIGRTGRAGASGLALSFVSAATEAHMRLIEKRQGLALAREVIAGFEPTQTATASGEQAAPPGTGGIKGRRPSKKDKLRAQAAQARQDKGTPEPGAGA
jgi:ATP-dependent RNA helicase RhlE